nr:hypothetical protein CFP56_78684 [Quercus suber]
MWLTEKEESPGLLSNMKGCPPFAILCGKLGHIERHCSESPGSQNPSRQYGDWLKANGNPKNGFGNSKASSSRGYEDRDGRPDDKSYLVTSNSGDSTSEHDEKSIALRTGQSLNDTIPVRVNAVEMSAVQTVENQVGLDKPGKSRHVPGSEKTSLPTKNADVRTLPKNFE